MQAEHLEKRGRAKGLPEVTSNLLEGHSCAEGGPGLSGCFPSLKGIFLCDSR